MRALSVMVGVTLFLAAGGCGTSRGNKVPTPPRPLASAEEQERTARQLSANLRDGLRAADIHSVALVSNVTPAQAATMDAWVERVRLDLSSDASLTVVSPLRAAPAVSSLGRTLPVDPADKAFMTLLAEALKVEGVVVIRPDPPESHSRLGVLLYNAAGEPRGTWNASFEFDLLSELKSDAKETAREEMDISKENTVAGSCCSCGIRGCLDGCLGLFCKSKP